MLQRSQRLLNPRIKEETMGIRRKLEALMMDVTFTEPRQYEGTGISEAR